MAPSIRIPNGFAFVPWVGGVVHNLLDAADRIGVDRTIEVRKVSGGYHVSVAVAEEYQKGFPKVTVEDEDAPVAERPDPSWTVAEIDVWADREGIIFPISLTKKAAKLAYIDESAQKSEHHEEE